MVAKSDGQLTMAFKRKINSWLSFASLHIIANFLFPLNSGVMFKVFNLQYLVFLFIFFSAFSLANKKCDRTPEFYKFRSEEGIKIWKSIDKDYKECRNSERLAAFYRAVHKCRKEKKGENIGGGCFHLAGMGGYKYKRPDITYCNDFKSSGENKVDYFNKLLDFKAEQKNIPICK